MRMITVFIMLHNFLIDRGELFQFRETEPQEYEEYESIDFSEAVIRRKQMGDIAHVIHENAPSALILFHEVVWCMIVRFLKC